MWIGSSTDIDDAKRESERLERIVAERTDELRELNQQMEEFVYAIAHDLRGPLRGIDGFAQIAEEEAGANLGDESRSALARIRKSADVMQRLIRDLLAFSRTARGQIELGPVHIDDAWKLALAQVSSQAEQAHAHIETSGPNFAVIAHEATLAQVFANLLSNSMKFVAPGVKPHVQLRREDRGANVRLWFVDNGIGIAPEQRERVFRVFERLHGQEYAGTGIGLSIVKKGVERMGGTIGLESEPGKGSSFWIELAKA